MAFTFLHKQPSPMEQYLSKQLRQAKKQDLGQILFELGQHYEDRGNHLAKTTAEEEPKESVFYYERARACYELAALEDYPHPKALRELLGLHQLVLNPSLFHKPNTELRSKYDSKSFNTLGLFYKGHAINSGFNSDDRAKYHTIAKLLIECAGLLRTRSKAGAPLYAETFLNAIKIFGNLPEHKFTSTPSSSHSSSSTGSIARASDLVRLSSLTTKPREETEGATQTSLGGADDIARQAARFGML